MQRVDLFQDREGEREFHFVVYTPGIPDARSTAPTLCGKQVSGAMRKAAWFRPGDPRGSVHYNRACDTCSERLSI